MNIFIGITFFAIFIHIISLQIAKIKYKTVITSFDYLVSLSFLVFITSVGSWTGLNLQLLLTVSIISVLLLQIKKSTRIQIVRPSLDLIFFYVTFTIFQIIFGFSSNFSQKLYVNPDPFGYASVTGSVNRFNSFPDLLKQFKSFTGTDFAYNLNWDDPSQFTKISSPWLIPDAGIKYGIGNGFYLHNGFSFLLRPLTQGSSLIDNFVIGWKFLTIFSAALLLSLILKSALTIFSKITLNDSNDKLLNHGNRLEKLLHLFYLGSILLILSLNSRWYSVYIFEGFGNQILSYAICIGTFIQIATFKEMKKCSKNIFLFIIELSLLFVTQFFVYAQQIPFQIICLIAGIIYSYNILKLFKKLHIVLPLLFATIILIINIPIVKVAFEALSSSGGGGATHLGVLTKLKTVGILPDNNFQINSVVDSNGKNLFIDLLWPNSHANGLGWNLRGQGYTPLIESITSVWVHLIISLILIIYLIFFINKKMVLLFSILILPLLFLEIYYLFTHTGRFLINNPNNFFNDYIWMRLNAYSSIYFWLLIICLFKIYFIDAKSQFKFKQSRSKKYGFISIILSCFLLWSIFNTFTVSKKVDSFSVTTKKIVNDCPSWFKSDGPNYVISNNMFPEVLITLCQADIRFLSDSFSVRHNADGNVHDVTSIKYFPETKSWKVSKIGTINFVHDIQSPCDMKCLMSSGIFTSQD
jgi:hypothetical protein